ncbi:ribosome maturation factor RimM [Jatrophihabitans sp. DSM 45814]
MAKTPNPVGSNGPGVSSAKDTGTNLVAVGRIGKAHGIKGAVYVEPWTDVPEERFVPGAVLETDPAERGPLTIAEVRTQSGKQIVQFEGIDDRNSAEAVRGTRLVIAATERPPIEDPDEFYDTDLIGLMAMTVQGVDVGLVTDVLHSPGDSLLAIDVAGREVLVPFRKQFVPVVDLAARTLSIDPPDGLLDL